MYAQKSAFDVAKRDLESFPSLHSPLGMAYRKAIRKYAPNSPYIPTEFKNEDDSEIDFSMAGVEKRNDGTGSSDKEIARLKQQILKLKQQQQQEAQIPGGIHSRLQQAASSLNTTPASTGSSESTATSAAELQEYEPLSTRRRRRGGQRHEDNETLKD